MIAASLNLPAGKLAGMPPQFSRSTIMDQKNVDEWIIAVLYMAGLNAGEIGQGKFLRSLAVKHQPKMAAKSIRANGLDVIRMGPARAKRLASLAMEAPPGFDRFVPRVLAKLAVQAKAKLNAGVEHAALRREMMIRCALPAQVDAIIAGLKQVGSAPPEATQEIVVDRKSTVRVNITDSPIEFLYRRDKIPQWAYEAANQMLKDWTIAEIGGLKAFDPSKDIVDTSMSTVGLSGGKLDAMQRLGSVEETFKYGYGSEQDRRKMRLTVWRYVIEQSPGSAWIGRIRQPIIPVLIDGLEHVAWVYGLGPTGPIAKHLEITMRR